MSDQPSTPRTVLITGAAGGIGRATVHLFTQMGWRVIGVDRAAFGESFPENGMYIQSDISVGENLDTIFQQAQALTGTLNALVNNAAVQVAKPLLETSVAEWDAVMASNLRSVFLGIKLSHPLFKAAGGGAIVNVSSVHAVATSANIAAYAASKGGLLGTDAGHRHRICARQHPLQRHSARCSGYAHAARRSGSRTCQRQRYPAAPG